MQIFTDHVSGGDGSFYAEAEINFCQSIAKKESDDVGNERDDSNVCQVDTVHSTTELKIKFSN